MRRPRLSLCAAPVLLCVAGIACAGYGDDRALIEDLQARYLFALDYDDPAAYAATFTTDGVLDYGAGEIKGRKAIARFIAEERQRDEQERAKTPPGKLPPTSRIIISNMVIEVHGNKAHGVAYWTHMSSGSDGRGTVDYFGHYEDEMRKVNGQWLFARRRIYNESIPEWRSQYADPVTHPSPPPKYRTPRQR
jgi:hypothetical protein